MTRAGWEPSEEGTKPGRLLRCTSDIAHYLPWPRDLEPLPKCVVCRGGMIVLDDVIVVPRAVWEEAVSAWAMEQAR